MKKAQSSQGLIGRSRTRSLLGLGGIFLTAAIWIGCQESAPSASAPAQDKSVSTSQSVTTAVNPAADICGRPGPSSSGGGTPRCNMYVTQPVCGCEGKTYQNGCLAWTYDVNVAYQGECKQMVK